MSLPCGIHVSRTESRLFLLLNAVLIPTTTKAFFLSSICAEAGFIREEGPAWEALAAANSISNIETVLSRFLTR